MTNVLKIMIVFYSMHSQRFEQSIVQPGMVVKPVRGQLNRVFFFFLCLRSCLRILSLMTGSAVPSRVSPLILLNKAESSIINHQSGACSQDFSRLPRRRPFAPSTAIIGSFPKLSGHHATAYRLRSSLPRVRRQKGHTVYDTRRQRCVGCPGYRE